MKQEWQNLDRFWLNFFWIYFLDEDSLKEV